MNGRTNSTSSAISSGADIPLDPISGFTVEEGTNKIMLTWTDPLDKYATPEGAIAQDPQQLVSVWSYTTIVKKEGSNPSNPNDGILVVNSAIRDQYKSTPFIDDNVTNDVGYYYAAFAINEDGVYSEGVYQFATPRAYDEILENNTWNQITEACSIGIASSFWEIGDEKKFTIDETEYTAVILGFNHDDLADGTGKASITFATKEMQPATISYNPYTVYISDQLLDRLYNLLSTKDSQICASINQDLITNILTVNKGISVVTYSDWITTDSGVENKEFRCFLLSEEEVTGTNNYSSNGEGTLYEYFATASNRIKYIIDKPNPSSWILRSARGDSYSISPNRAYRVWLSQIDTSGTSAGGYRSNMGNGTMSENYTPKNIPFIFAFCIGKQIA